MSQITRCPSCSTSFKVVADQLRISEGWVRCGQCKEVFDAVAHLLPAPPPALLPDVSLTDVRPPPMPVPRKPETGRAWGEPDRASSRAALPRGRAAPAAPAAPLYAAEDFSLLAPAVPAQRSTVEPLPAVPEAPGLSEGASPSEPPHVDPDVPAITDSVLAVPQPVVPAFLAADSRPERGGAHASLEPLLAPFAWHAQAGRSKPGPGEAAAGDGASLRPTGGPAGTAQTASHHTAGLPEQAETPFVVALAPSSPSTRAAGEGAVPPVLAGYELPAADDLRDEELEGLLDNPSFESTTVPAGLTPMGYPALELPVRPAAAPPSQAAAAHEPQALESLPSSPASTMPPAVRERAAEPLPPVDFVQQSEQADLRGPSVPQGLALVEDDSPAAVLQAKPRKSAANAPDDDEPASSASEEVSFVVAARRKAFWRKPAVRAVLGIVLVAAMLALAMQVAVQERDRIVAMDARARPWLMQLCAPLQCEIAPRRQISDVVIDSSSFNKARGDSYQLTLAMKSKAHIPLAMPAVELTLTDAQDQPVLRRVLLPADMGAPAELSALGEWSTSVSVVVTTGGARVAGYRLLAFYP